MATKNKFRIAITGPESSGKTSLANGISEFYGIKAIPEFAREYLLTKDLPHYDLEDMAKMAHAQYEAIIASKERDLVVADTEMLVYKIWYEEKFNILPTNIELAISNQCFDHYLLCYPDIPWEFDPLRENPEDRMRLFDKYEAALIAYKFPYTIITGSLEKRILQAKEILLKI